MTNRPPRNNTHVVTPDSSSLKFLEESSVEMIDEALAAVGEFGEVHLIVQKGRLRFIVTKNSHDALKWHPGSLESDDK